METSTNIIHFNCNTCTTTIMKSILETLDYDLTEVTICDYINKQRYIFKNETKIKILEYVNNLFSKNHYACDQINHINITCGNDGREACETAIF